jgi:O-methyltransferase
MLTKTIRSVLGTFGLDIRKKSAGRTIRMPLQLERDMPVSAQGGADGQNGSSAAGEGLPRVKRALRLAFDTAGLEVVRLSNDVSWRAPVELSKQECDIVAYIKQNELSSSSYERLWATAMACKHVMDCDIPGDFVECGVMRGGQAIIAAAMFNLHSSTRKVYLFDTFAGMTAPTEKDKDAATNTLAKSTFNELQRDSHNDWCYASLDDVKANFRKAGLLDEKIIFIQGDVAVTLEVPNNLPERIAVLRLDTDWYESTKKELEILYPRLAVGGVLLVDDYGHWAGAREAVDEYFKGYNNRPFLVYNDNTGRAGVKVA